MACVFVRRLSVRHQLPLSQRTMLLSHLRRSQDDDGGGEEENNNENDNDNNKKNDGGEEGMVQIEA